MDIDIKKHQQALAEFCDISKIELHLTVGLNDYMAVGRPVVTTGVGELADLVPRYQLGVATRDDADDFAAYTLNLLADVDRCEAIGKTARRAAEEVFSWGRMVDALEAFYQQVLNSR